MQDYIWIGWIFDFLVACGTFTMAVAAFMAIKQHAQHFRDSYQPIIVVDAVGVQLTGPAACKISLNRIKNIGAGPAFEVTFCITHPSSQSNPQSKPMLTGDKMVDIYLDASARDSSLPKPNDFLPGATITAQYHDRFDRWFHVTGTPKKDSGVNSWFLIFSEPLSGKAKIDFSSPAKKAS